MGASKIIYFPLVPFGFGHCPGPCPGGGGGGAGKGFAKGLGAPRWQVLQVTSCNLEVSDSVCFILAMYFLFIYSVIRIISRAISLFGFASLAISIFLGLSFSGAWQ